LHRSTVQAAVRSRRTASPLVWPLLLALIASLLLAGCGEDDTPGEANPFTSSTAASGESEGEAFPRTITDSSDTAVTIKAEPQRIVSLSPAATEVLYAIGAGDRVVGTDSFSNYPPEAEETAKLDYSQPDPEATLALDPDLVIMVTRQQEQVEQFRDLGMTVLYFEEAATVDGVYDSIETFGELTGHDSEAKELVADMRERIEAVTSKLTDVAAGPRVFYEVTTDLYSASPDTFIGSMLTLLKARNIAEGATTQFPQLTAEAVIEANPEVILLADAKYANQDAGTVAARPGWAGVSAVQTKRIVAVDDDIASRPGPRIVDAIEAIAEALYPDKFN
jgi:iron complex transport system substrate-binding protein